MKCPIDGTELLMTHRANVEIDYCPECRGVWLDRGELDKIIERSYQQENPAPRPEERYREEEHRSYDDDAHYRSPKKSKRKSFLDDLFDF